MTPLGITAFVEAIDSWPKAAVAIAVCAMFTIVGWAWLR